MQRKTLLAGMAMLATTGLASAEVIVSTMGSVQSGYSGRIGLYYQHAAQFTTDGSAYMLTSVQARVQSGTVSHAWIFDDQAGLPGNAIFQLQSVGGGAGFRNLTFNAGSAFELAPDTTYHLVVLSPDDATAVWALALPGGEQYEGSGEVEHAREHSIGTGWNQDVAYAMMFGVNGWAICPGDFNRDRSVNTIDVLAFLNAWSAGEARGDFNGDGSNNTLDVLSFLNAWSSGC